MRVLKRIFQVLLFLLIAILLFIVVVFEVDAFKTNYLKRNVEIVDSYVIENVNLVPMTSDAVLYHQKIWIEKGRIKAYGDALESEGLKVIDGQNQYVMPGLVDMHVHLWDKYELGLYLANGVTAIRNVWGMPMHLRWKRAIARGEMNAPMFFTSGPKLTGPEFIGDDNLQLFSAEEGIEKVKRYKKKGYDFIKTYYGLTEDIYDAIMKQAIASDMDIIAHPSQKVPYAYHYKAPIVTIEHAEDIVQQPLQYKLDTAQLRQVVSSFSKAEHTSFCPTLIAYYNIYKMLEHPDILESDRVEYMNPAIQILDSKPEFERWEYAQFKDSTLAGNILKQHNFQMFAINQLNNAGVNIVCGTDAGIGVTAPGFSIHEELKWYKKAGLSNYDVLRTATINVSKTHKVMQNMGSIEPGKLANLILLKENPLEKLDALENPQLVIVGGKVTNRDTLDLYLSKAKNRPNLLGTVFRYLENMLVEN